VNAGAIAFLVAAAVLAVGDWVSRARDDARLEYVCKPGTLTALIAVAVLLDPRHDAVRAWFVAALVLSLVGDVLLMLPREQFVGGLAAFLLAHVCYIAGFVASGLRGWVVAVAIAGTALVVAPVARRILRGVAASEPALRPPVVAYLVVIATMLACAVASGNAFAAVGAALFVTSDSMIAWDRFVGDFPAAPIAIMVTYHLAQAGFVLSLLH
jgi:uncharacterized membrane protein YhhN